MTMSSFVNAPWFILLWGRESSRFSFLYSFFPRAIFCRRVINERFPPSRPPLLLPFPFTPLFPPPFLYPVFCASPLQLRDRFPGRLPCNFAPPPCIQRRLLVSTAFVPDLEAIFLSVLFPPPFYNSDMIPHPPPSLNGFCLVRSSPFRKSPLPRNRCPQNSRCREASEDPPPNFNFSAHLTWTPFLN